MRTPGARYDLVEVGCGQSPAVFMEGGVRMPQGTSYLGIGPFVHMTDKEIGDFESLVQACNEGTVHIRRGDGRYTGLPDDSTKRVLFVDVFGWSQSVGTEDGGLAEEAARIVDDEGEVVVVETISPWVVGLSRLREIMGAAGLQQKNEGSEHDQEHISAYRLLSPSFVYHRPQHRPYIAVFGRTIGNVAVTSANS